MYIRKYEIFKIHKPLSKRNKNADTSFAEKCYEKDLVRIGE
jgi:hypothetical protein